ncbi:MAG: histidine kinase [Modestobacter sp.]|nr:histidine kinase [Modestobacter sp.]
MTEPPRSPAPAAGDDGQLRISSPLAGMRLTQLLTEMQDRLATVARTQERVQDLLDAFLSVSAGLDLDTTLHQIAEAATGLVDARYGALGVLRPGGGLGAFITAGIDQELADRMGHLPEGKGVLGQLITAPHPLRISDLGAHSSSLGFPEQHPPMRTFLGVPVLVRGEVFGNLYMTEKRDGEFTAEDEAVLTRHLVHPSARAARRRPGATGWRPLAEIRSWTWHPGQGRTSLAPPHRPRWRSVGSPRPGADLPSATFTAGPARPRRGLGKRARAAPRFRWPGPAAPAEWGAGGAVARPVVCPRVDRRPGSG